MPQTSATLLDRLRDRRDDAAWSRLVDLYTPLIRGWLLRHLPQSADVDDLAQQVFAVVEKYPAFAHNGRSGAFRAWLRGISANRIRMFWRTLPEGGGYDHEPWLQQLEDPHSDLSKQWDREHDQHVARHMLSLIQSQFEPNTWRAFWLLVLDEREPEAVAAEVGSTVNAVFIAKSRVLRRLREEMAGFVL